MNEQDMFELLEIYDARSELEKVQEMLCGMQEAVGYGEGILGKLSYVTDIIKRHSPIYKGSIIFLCGKSAADPAA